MEHKFFDDDIEGCDLVKDGDEEYVVIDTCEDEDGNFTSCIQLKIEDLQYMANRLGGALQSVSPNEVTTRLTREDIIMLAKTAGITAEELV